MKATTPSTTTLNAGYIKRFPSLTLESESGKPTLYGHTCLFLNNPALMAGDRKMFLASWDSIEEAKSALEVTGVSYTDLTA
jgi:hypothetical protein